MPSTRDNINRIRKFSRLPGYYRQVTSLFEGAYSDSSIAWIAFLAGNSAISKEDFQRVGGFDPEFRHWGFEHFELGFRLLKAGIQICHLPAAASYHIPHQRTPGYFRKNIERSAALFSSKHPTVKVDLLTEFLFGAISLQDFELRFSQKVSSSLLGRKPIFYTQLQTV